jgi:hypothetical protein
MLTELIADLSRQPELRKRFDASPHSFLDAYGVTSEDARKAVLGRDISALLTLLCLEAGDLVRKLVPDARFFWPGNQMELRSVDPSSGATGKSISFTVKGQLFEDGAWLTFERPDSTVVATNVQVTSSGLDSTLTGNATFNVAGAYDVSVTNPDKQSVTLPSGFTAE